MGTLLLTPGLPALPGDSSPDILSIDEVFCSAKAIMNAERVSGGKSRQAFPA
jgi:hypothetical protein